MEATKIELGRISLHCNGDGYHYRGTLYLAKIDDMNFYLVSTILPGVSGHTYVASKFKSTDDEYYIVEDGDKYEFNAPAI